MSGALTTSRTWHCGRSRAPLQIVSALLAVLFAALPVQAAELIYVHSPSCSYCRAWEAAVGKAYPNSEEARVAPLRAIELSDLGRSGLTFAKPVRYTPTFILVDKGAEIGRIEGYPGPDFFWGMLDRLLEKLDPAPAAPKSEPLTRIRLAP
jgi:hypothetical protein